MTQTKQACHCGEKTSCGPKLRPLADRVLVRRLKAEEKAGSIILPEAARKKQEQAEVMGVGTGKKDKNGNLLPISVKKGDIVLIDKYSGQEITIEDQEYLIVRADDLIAIVEK